MKNQDLKWWHVRWRWAVRPAIVLGKVIGSLCLLAAIARGVLYLNAPWLGSKLLSEGDTRLSMVPVDLPTKAEAPLSNATIDCYGFRVPLPSKEIFQTLDSDYNTEVLFRDRGTLTIRNPERYPELLEIARNDKHAEKWFGKEASQSKFKLMQAVMWATPEQAKWWKFRSLENQRVESLLEIKSGLTDLMPPDASMRTPIYAISVGRFRGFEIGNPDVPPYSARVDLFDGADRHLRIDVSGLGGHGPVLTQTEINAIVASIRTTPDH